MVSISIRPYEDGDLDAITALWEIVFPDDAARNRASVAIPQKQAFQPGLIFVAEDNGTVIGTTLDRTVVGTTLDRTVVGTTLDRTVVGTTMAGYDGHRGWLYGVAVHPDHQRQGVATALVNHAIAKLRSLGCLKVNLQIREGNEAVIAFYESLGFEVEPRTSMGKFIGGRREPT